MKSQFQHFFKWFCIMYVTSMAFFFSLLQLQFKFWHFLNFAIRLMSVTEIDLSLKIDNCDKMCGSFASVFHESMSKENQIAFVQYTMFYVSTFLVIWILWNTNSWNRNTKTLIKNFWVWMLLLWIPAKTTILCIIHFRVIFTVSIV